MPMNWNAENDRTLLLKLIETHGISVQSDLIAKAWPADAHTKPTARAITERFVKLRQLAGIKVSVKSNANTPAKAYTHRTLKTPKSSAKKRKMDETSESDADDHFTTEEDSPTKRKSAQRGGARASNGGGVRVKTGIKVPSVPIDGCNMDELFPDVATRSASFINSGQVSQDWKGLNGGAYLNGNGNSNGNDGMPESLYSPTSRLQLGGQSVAQEQGRPSRQASHKAHAAWKQEDGGESSDWASEFQTVGSESDYA